MSIFREEALEHNSDTEYGDIVLPASFGMSVCAVATLLIFLSVSLFVYYGSYTRKAHLTGIVMPSSGLVKITPQYAGYVTRQTVSEGQHVAAGEPVYHISGEHYIRAGHRYTGSHEHVPEDSVCHAVFPADSGIA